MPLVSPYRQVRLRIAKRRVQCLGGSVCLGVVRRSHPSGSVPVRCGHFSFAVPGGARGAGACSCTVRDACVPPRAFGWRKPPSVAQVRFRSDAASLRLPLLVSFFRHRFAFVPRMRRSTSSASTPPVVLLAGDSLSASPRALARSVQALLSAVRRFSRYSRPGLCAVPEARFVRVVLFICEVKGSPISVSVRSALSSAAMSSSV